MSGNMKTEIERKFKITLCDLSRLGEGEQILQGYLSFNPQVRVRMYDDRAVLTVKGPGTHVREEYEYDIPIGESLNLLSMAKACVSKTRYSVGPLEIDVFGGNLTGLIMAELELPSLCELGHPINKPAFLEWVEVTGDPEYLNVNLAQHGLPIDHAKNEASYFHDTLEI